MLCGSTQRRDLSRHQSEEKKYYIIIIIFFSVTRLCQFATTVLISFMDSQFYIMCKVLRQFNKIDVTNKNTLKNV